MSIELCIDGFVSYHETFEAAINAASAMLNTENVYVHEWTYTFGTMFDLSVGGTPKGDREGYICIPK